MDKAIIEWLFNGHTGASSKTMAAYALGIKPKDISYPHDPSDLNRCLLLLKSAPSVRNAFPQIAASRIEWGRLIEHWDDIVATFHNEVGEGWVQHNKPATKTYALMRKIIESQ